MKKIAIILGLLLFAQSAFAGGTVLMLDSNSSQAGYYNPYSQEQTVQQLDPNAVYFTKDGIYSATDGTTQAGTKKVTYTKRKFRLGRQQNDPNGYWNFGRVNFGNGFTTVGGGDKKY